MEAVECVGCQQEVAVEPGAHADDDAGDSFVLEGNDWDELEAGQTYEQYYEWRLGDQEGLFTAETQFWGDTSDACDNWDPSDYDEEEDEQTGASGEPDQGCSSGGSTSPVGFLAVLVVGFAAVALRRTVGADAA